MTDNITKLFPQNDPDEVLESQKGNFSEIFIIGYDHEGEVRIASNNGKASDLLWIMESVKLSLLMGNYEEE